MVRKRAMEQATAVFQMTSRGSTLRTMVPDHCLHSHARCGKYCGIIGAEAAVEEASDAISLSSSRVPRARLHRSPPSIAMLLVGSAAACSGVFLTSLAVRLTRVAVPLWSHSGTHAGADRRAVCERGRRLFARTSAGR